MNKRKWEVWSFDFPGKGVHPVVLISHPDRCARGDVVNVLYCTSQRQARPVKETEVLLDQADGFDWETYARCDLIYAIASEQLVNRRGQLSRERRRAIRAKLISVFGLLEED